MYVPRRLDQTILGFINRTCEHKNVLLVEGARQVGKTALTENAVARSGKRHCCVNLEKDSLLRLLIDECTGFEAFTRLLRDRLDFHPDTDSVLFIDEAQESLMLGGFVRFMKEDWPRATVILSGSTLRRLFRKGVRYPVGRVTELILGPFSFSEYLTARGKKALATDILDPEVELDPHQHTLLLDLFDRFLELGGLPAVVLAEPEDALLVRAQIIADYERDFIRLFGEELLPIVKSCFRSVASFVGSPSKNTSVVANPSSFVNEKINDVFSRLESWHLLILSEQRGPGPEGSHGYLPKRYMFDTGVLRHFREATVPSIRLAGSLPAAARIPLGGIIENQLGVELSRSGMPVYGWKKSSSGVEIDFVQQAPSGTVPIECKAALSVNLKHTRGLCEYMRLHEQDYGLIVSLAPQCTLEPSGGGRIRNLPVYLTERLHSHLFEAQG
jgi:predicted AAA+ superfamily ATPase